ncbi:store-operated calcium entry regulator STIMATE-like [Haliotis rufescens]|uniref:store-operated calcium entry regulator STIMATE-like n=1 Tax=Haliotis rufescens TaxID=6454 RepID=UPI001EB02504|nr:store-operated calcium entry regulator STIMATE-like [Haliotis rufescens]
MGLVDSLTAVQIDIRANAESMSLTSLDSDQSPHKHVYDVNVSSDPESQPKFPSESGILHCTNGDLLGPLGLLVQGLLALLAFSCLIAKRYCEPKHARRPWRIWFYDTSKQGFGAAVLHFANVFLADMFQDDPCTWYFISFLLDSTIGILIIYLGLKLTQIIVRRNKLATLYFGEYGDPPQCNAWVGQCGLYILVMVVEKILVTLLVLFKFWTKVRAFIMSPIKEPKLELVLVMFLVPLVVNAFIFWIVDNFLKQSIQNTKHVYVNSDETSVKYFKGSERVRCYNRIEKAEDFESDMLLSTDEDGDTRQRSLDSSISLLPT